MFQLSLCFPHQDSAINIPFEWFKNQSKSNLDQHMHSAIKLMIEFFFFAVDKNTRIKGVEHFQLKKNVKTLSQNKKVL